MNKHLGTIRLFVGNNGPRISVGTKVTFSNLDQLVVGEHIATHGSFDGNVWNIALLEVGEYAEIAIQVDNLGDRQVVVTATISGKYHDPDNSNNTFTFYIGNTGVER